MQRETEHETATSNNLGQLQEANKTTMNANSRLRRPCPFVSMFLSTLLDKVGLELGSFIPSEV